MRKVMPLLAAAVLSVLLSGCFTSQIPKFSTSKALPLFGDGGRYAVLEHAADGKFERKQTLTVKKLSDGSYEFSGEKDTAMISFFDVGNGVIVAQAKPEDKRGYIYLIVSKKGSEVYLHLPQCDKQDAAVLSGHNLIRRDKFECAIDKVAAPAKLFATVDPGEPTSKIIPE